MSVYVSFGLTNTTCNKSTGNYDETTSLTFKLTTSGGLRYVLSDNSFYITSNGQYITDRCVITKNNKREWSITIPANTMTGTTIVHAESGELDYSVPITKSYIRKGGDDKVDYNFDYDNITFTSRVVDGKTEYYYECSDYEDFSSKFTNQNQTPTLSVAGRVGMHAKGNYGVSKSKLLNNTIDWGFNSYCIINQNNTSQFSAGIKLGLADAVTDKYGNEWYTTAYLVTNQNWSSRNCFGGYNEKDYTVDNKTYGYSLGLDDSIFEEYEPLATTYTITNTLSNCSNNNADTSVDEHDSYSATVTATSGYYFETANVSVMMGNTAIIPTFNNDYTAFTISIADVTDDIVITASASVIPVVTYTVTNNLTNCSNDNSATSVNTGDSYVAHVTASSGYHFETTDVVVMMGSTRVPVVYASNNKSFTISISNVTDDIVITASATEWYTVSYNPIINATSDNPATRVREGDSYIATITANSGYFFDGHKSAGAYNCVINVQEYSSQLGLTTYNDTHTVGVLSIANVDRNLTIRAVATNDGAVVTNNLTHCTSNNNSTVVSKDNYYYIATLTADDGYVFPQNKSTITVRVDNVTLFPSLHNNVVTISQDGKYAYIDTREYDSMATYNKSSIVITATAISDSGLRVTNSLTDCSTNNPTTSLQYGDSYTATVTATNGYYFDSNDVTVMMGNTAITPTFNIDNTSFTISIASATDDIVITASATMIPVVTHSVTNNLTNCSNSNSATSVVENSNYIATVTATSGYRFNRNDVTVIMGSTSISPTFASDNKSFTITITNVTDDIVITASATAIPSHSITNNLTNCSNSNSATTILDGDSYTATVTATSGYYFESANISVMVGNTSVTPTLASDSKSFTISISNVTDNIVITASASVILQEFTVTNNLTNCSNSNNATTAIENSSYTATVTATSGYYFESANVSVMIGSTSVTPTFASDNKSFTISIANVTDDIVITASATMIPVSYYTVTNALTNCSNNNSATTVNVNDSYTATITAFTDYHFSALNVSVMMGSTAITPTFASDNKSFTISIANVTNNIVITASATSDAPVVVSDFGTCYVYNPLLTELEDMMGHVTDNHYQDRTNDIIRLYKTYVSIPVKTTKENIMLGDWNTTVSSDVVSQQYLTIECGNVTLSEVNENVIDYSPFTSLRIFLPFIGIKDLDIDVYRNKTINLKYKFDVISGKCVALLSVNGTVYDQFEGEISDDVPYTGKQTVVYTTGDYTVGRYNITSKVSTGEAFNSLAMSNNYPYFIVTQNVGYSPNSNIDGIANYETATLSDVTGLIKVNNIHLETLATNKEKREIELLLMQGVFIKENT